MSIVFLRKALAGGALGLAALALSMHASAQAYPAKPVKMVVAFEPGGATDIGASSAGIGDTGGTAAAGSGASATAAGGRDGSGSGTGAATGSVGAAAGWWIGSDMEPSLVDGEGPTPRAEPC